MCQLLGYDLYYTNCGGPEHRSMSSHGQRDAVDQIREQLSLHFPKLTVEAAVARACVDPDAWNITRTGRDDGFIITWRLKRRT